ncbi:unnamed protein product [Colias eurytheme]|nr:unnamed protein product [Colias eurytheme]
MLFKITLVVALCATLPVQGIDVCKTHDKILNAGYPAERYDVRTEDGYILEVNRIPRGRNQFGSSRRPVVFMMHGLSGCSSNYIEMGPDYAIGFNLADAGYDVWLGNARGVGNSRRHVSLNPDHNRQKLEFFDFSWEEIGVYDLPAMINFALEKSGQDKLHYIGHSQGGTVFLVLNSMKPEFNDKFISAHLLAGVGYQNHFPNGALKTAAAFTNTIYGIARAAGIVELNGPENAAALNEVSAYNVDLEDVLDQINNSTDIAAGSSLKQYAHYGQNINDKVFRRWYYSPVTNLLKYGSLTPPKYDLKKITVDITMHYTVSDELLDERDVLEMVKDLPKANARKVAREDFSHVDFVVATDARQLVTEYIIEDLRRR